MKYRRGIIPTLHRLVAYIGIAVSALVVLMACTSEGSTTAPQQTSSPQREATQVMEPTSPPSSTTEATDAPSPTPSAVFIDTPRPTSTPESIVDSFDCNDQRFIDEIVQLSEENENPSAPHILKMYVDAVEEIERTDKLLRCRTEVRLSTDQERYATYHLEIDRDGDAFIGYQLGEVTSVPTPLPTSTPANTPDPSRPAGVGDTIRLKYVELTLNSVRGSHGNGTYVPRTGNHFVHIDATARNISDRSIEVFYLIGGVIQDGENQTFEPEFRVTQDERLPHFIELGAGQASRTSSHFELPKNATNLTWIVSEDSMLLTHGGSQDEVAFYLDSVRSPLPVQGRGQENPAQIGIPVTASNHAEVRVANVIQDARELIADEPAQGRRFLMISVEIAALDSYRTTYVSASHFLLTGENNATYTQNEDNCGVVPAALERRSFYGTGRKEGNICFHIPLEEHDLILIYAPSREYGTSSDSGLYRYFSLEE